jgi:hypothetical protein
MNTYNFIYDYTINKKNTIRTNTTKNMMVATLDPVEGVFSSYCDAKNSGHAAFYLFQPTIDIIF